MAPKAPPAIAFAPNALVTISTTAPGIAFTLITNSTRQNNTYITAIKGTTTCDTLAILLIPPIRTRATNTVRTIPAITTATLVSLPKILITFTLSELKKLPTALVIPFTCVNVPIPIRPTHTPKNANILPSHFHFLPIPFSI